MAEQEQNKVQIEDLVRIPIHDKGKWLDLEIESNDQIYDEI